MVFLISGQGYFTFLYGYATHNREDGRKEEQTVGLGLAPSARGGSLWHFLCILWANTSVNSHKATSNADFCWLVSSLPYSHLIIDLFCWLVSSAPFCWLCPSLDCSLMPTVLPSSVEPFFPRLSGLSHGRSRMQVFHVGFAPKQTKGFSAWHPHRQKRMPPIVSHCNFILSSISKNN